MINHVCRRKPKACEVKVSMDMYTQEISEKKNWSKQKIKTDKDQRKTLMAMKDNFVHGGCRGSDTMMRLKDRTENLCISLYLH